MQLLAILFSTLVCVSAVATPKNVPIDTGGSEIIWKGSKEFVDGTHTGTIKIKKGFLTIDGEKITGGEIVVDMSTIKNTDLTDPNYNTKLINHLVSPDFFDTTKYPESKFKINKVISNTETTTFEGDLTVKDKTNPLRVTANIEKQGKLYLAKGHGDFDRSKFNVKYNSPSFFPDLIKTGKDKVIRNLIQLDFTIKTRAEQ